MNNIIIDDQAYWIRVNKHYHYPILRGDVLISIKNKFAEKIYAGTKTYELRHQVPNITPGQTMWIYEPKPVGMITGFVEYQASIIAAPWWIWLHYKRQLGVTHDEFLQYYQNRKTACAWKLTAPVRLDHPISLANIGLKRPPQSYQFLNLTPSNNIGI